MSIRDQLLGLSWKRDPTLEASRRAMAGQLSSRLEFRILGPLEVSDDGRTIDLGPPRRRALLAVLLLHVNEVVSRERLIEEVWGGTAPASAANMIQVYVSGLRKELGDGLLLTQAPGYVLRLDAARLDAARFEDLVVRARQAMDERRVAETRTLLQEAMALWRGPPLADFSYESFAQGQVARLEELRLEAIELRTDADLALGQDAGLVGGLEQLIAAHPFRERFRGQLMLALYRSGRQAEALEAYRAARRALVEELGIEPSPALQQLERAILAQAPELQDGGQESVPVPLTEPVSTGNLPLELTTLFGRELDLERIAELVLRHRLVTVVGPGGVGKTRVAQRVASTAAGGFEHGVWWVDLATIGHAGDVAGAVASAIAIADRPGAAALQTVVQELRERTLLLVLDNCEHVLGAAAALTARVVGECPGVRILATSREPLAIAGERVARLEPLATGAHGSELPAAVALFLDRAAIHGVSWEQPEEVLDTITELCVRLDGLPLAIELAAARTRAISPAELLAHLDDRLRLLTGPSHWSAHAHQLTLECTIAWSYELLSELEQATLRRLSVFQGGFSLAAAAAVCGDIGAELDTLERMTALVDRSVVSIRRRHESDRYRLLESIGVFAQQRLREQDEADHARDRHARFFAEFAQDEPGRPDHLEQAARAAWLDLEQDNLTAALEWCLDGGGDPTVGAELAGYLGFHWVCRGRSHAAEHWFERALARREQVAPAAVIAVHLAYAVLAFSTGDLDRSTVQSTEAVLIAREINDDERLAEALATLAIADQARGANAEAIATATELRSLQPHLSSPRGKVMARIGTAQVALATGHPDEATADASGAREIARLAGDHLHAAMSGFWLAYALALDSATPAARTAIGEAMDDAVRSGYQLLVVDNLIAATSLALADHDPAAAGRLLPQAIEMLRDQGRWEDVGTRLHVAAAVEFNQGSPERSAVLLGAARRCTDHVDFQDELLLPQLAGLGDALKDRLGTTAFAEATERGAAMALDDVPALLPPSWTADT